MLTDSFARVHDYLRISVTERCNLRCTYCMPESGIPLKPKDSLLTASEIQALAEIFVSLGIKKIRITGGEPLVRRDIDDVVAKLGTVEGLQEFALSTNGSLLKEKLPSLHAAGIRQVNISLDTLRPERFEAITRRANFAEVFDSILAAAAFKNPSSLASVKINAVVMRGVNDDELLDFVRFGAYLNLMAKTVGGGEPLPSVEVRFIEFMPFKNNGWSEHECVPYNEMRQRIESIYHLEEISQGSGVPGPAKSFRVRETGSRIGFITSMTEHFCGDCNRLRLTADGMFRTCLFGNDSVNLRDMLRNGSSLESIENAIRNALSEKWEAHAAPTELIQISDRDMIAIGG